jgi:hypothetical protein
MMGNVRFFLISAVCFFALAPPVLAKPSDAGRSEETIRCITSYFSFVVAQPELQSVPQVELNQALLSGYDVLAPRDLLAFHELNRDYLEHGGTFVIDEVDESRASRGIFIRVLHSGKYEIHIPRTDITRAAENAPSAKAGQLQMIGSLVHELRHYTTMRRIAARLDSKDQAGSGHYRSRLFGEHEIRHIGQLENEARSVEQRLNLNGPNEEVGKYLYPVTEQMRHWINEYQNGPQGGKLGNLPREQEAVRYADLFCSEFVDYLSKYSYGRELPSSLQSILKAHAEAIGTVGKDRAIRVLLKSEAIESFALISDRLSKEQQRAFVDLIAQRARFQRRRIEQVLQKLYESHPESTQ